MPMPPARRTEDAPAEVDLGILNDVIGFRIRRIQNHLSRAFAERVNSKDVKPGLFSALALIQANPGLSQTTLSREIGFDKATVVALLDSLERLEWAERRRSPDDRRRHSLYITRKGQAALKALRTQALANEAAIHEVLSDEEQAQLFSLLDKIYGVCFSDER
jgi:DNA-binding MarR family transcriptional regulator